MNENTDHQRKMVQTFKVTVTDGGSEIYTPINLIDIDFNDRLENESFVAILPRIPRSWEL